MSLPPFFPKYMRPGLTFDLLSSDARHRSPFQKIASSSYYYG
jgi:hypothetical protein